MKTQMEFKYHPLAPSGTSPGALAGMLLLCLLIANSGAQTYTVLHAFNQGGFNDGRNPLAGLVVSGEQLYGVTWVGGDSGRGAVFSLKTDGSGYTVLKEFTKAEGGLPDEELVVSGTKLYGTTSHDSITNYGALFSVRTDGTDYAVLKEFTGNDGAVPAGCLVLSGATLYGTTRDGGSHGYGTVFKVNTDGTSFAVLKNFENRGDGGRPYAGLVLSGAMLYGTTSQGQCIGSAK